MILGTPGASTAFDVGQSSISAGFYRRTDNTIWYESPNWSGFSFEADYTLSAHKIDASSIGGPSIDPRVISLGAKFQPEGAPFYVDLSFEQHDDLFGLIVLANANGIGVTGADSSKDTGIQIGAGYQLGDLGLNVRYERLKYELSGGGADSNYKRNAYWLGVKYNVPTGYIGAEIGIAQDGKLDGNKQDDTGATMFGVGYFHNLSKQSQLQFIYGLTKNKDNATYTQAGSPGAFGTGIIAPGQDSQVFHVGIKHTY
jgi:predicted porin